MERVVRYREFCLLFYEALEIFGIKICMNIYPKIPVSINKFINSFLNVRRVYVIRLPLNLGFLTILYLSFSTIRHSFLHIYIFIHI